MGRDLNCAGFPPFRRKANGAGIYSYDVRQGLTRGDEHLAKYFGVSAADFAHGIPRELLHNAIHPEDRARVLQAVERTVHEGSKFEAQYRTLPHGGEVYVVQATGVCFRDDEGQPLSFVGTIEPISNAVDNVDRTIEYALAAYKLAGRARKPTAQYLIALALEDMGFVLPTHGGDH